MAAAVAGSLFLALAITSSFHPVPVQGQDAVPPANLIEGATTVPDTQTAAGTPLFQAETIQFTESVVSSLRNSEDAVVRQHAPRFVFAGDAANEGARRTRSALCKTAPEDKAWPTKAEWGIFNRLLSGALNVVKPIASPCYKDSAYNNYDVAKCEQVSRNWATPELHISDPGSIMWPLYQGKTCMPATTSLEGTLEFPVGACTSGGYASYSVNATTVAHVQLAVNFARNSDMRLVVKNTGHDYNGRSTGRDALSIWTHHLNGIRFIEHYVSKGSGYSGPAFKVGAGVLVHELYDAAEKYGVTVVGGICPTVGISAGYILGGGHSPVMQLFGMGSDQVLALEVVTASGKFLTATPNTNKDLYWALLGGGGGTFGVVTSAIMKAHPKIPVTTSTFSFGGASSNVSDEVFWQGFTALWESFPAWNAAKTYSYFFLSNSTAGMSLSMDAFFSPNKTPAEFQALINPFLANLTALGIRYTDLDTRYHQSFLPAFKATFEPMPQFIGNAANVNGNRLIPASNWANATIRSRTISAIKRAVSNSIGMPMYHQAPLPLPPHQANLNSVNPAFRTEASMIIGVGIPSMSDSQLGDAARAFTNNVVGPLREVTPTGGTYGNEADVNEPDWNLQFWGQNYQRLLRIKKEWDPESLFLVHHGVGSEEWQVVGGEKWGGIPTQDGRLCRKSK